jgi:hypothetical protein
VLTRTFDGLSKGYKGSLVPVLSTEMSLFDAVRKLDHLQGSVLPTSSRKISHCKVGRSVLRRLLDGIEHQSQACAVRGSAASARQRSAVPAQQAACS